MQGILDTVKTDGFYILTGSNNFLLQQSISQSLAGRIDYLDLLPLCYREILQFGKINYTTNELIRNGGYPELYGKNRQPGIWFPSYIRTYIERDVKLLRNIDNTILFNRFLQLCAGRVGQQLNIAALSIESGVDVKTAQSWLGILQSIYIIMLLPPHFKNYNKRVVKTPKLYFLDTGLACSLLGIRKDPELQNSHFRGALFENFVLLEILKQKYNTGSQALLYYWKENNGLEIDLLIDNGKKIVQVEIKAAQTFDNSYFKNIIHWNKIIGNKGGIVVYDGEKNITLSGNYLTTNWKGLQLKL